MDSGSGIGPKRTRVCTWPHLWIPSAGMSSPDPDLDFNLKLALNLDLRVTASQLRSHKCGLVTSSTRPQEATRHFRYQQWQLSWRSSPICF